MLLIHKLKKTLLLSVIFVGFLFSAHAQFVHPGLSHKKSDIERMKYMVQAGIEPWKTSYNNLLNDSKSSSTYTVLGKDTMRIITQDGTNYSAFKNDVKAAYLNALRYAISGDEANAKKAVEIFNAWSNITRFTAGGTESLNAGRVIWQFVEGAELIKSLYSGWAAADILKFKAMLVYPGYSTTTKPSTADCTFYWRMYQGDPGRHGNQDLFGWRGVMAIAIFSDNKIMYDRALRYVSGLSARTDDIPYQTGPPIISSSPSATNDYFDTYTTSGYKTTTANYGYNGVLKNYIWENGQCQESSRDQDHGVLGIGMMASIAEIAWNQGDDMYSLLNNRILKGYEFSMHYNVSYENSYPDQLTPWEPTVESGEFIQRHDRSGRWYSKKINPTSEGDFTSITRGGYTSDLRPIYELALGHYQSRMGLPEDSMKWTIRANNKSKETKGYEQNGWSLDHLGWGDLTCHRPLGCAGDPISSYANSTPIFAMNVLPGSIEAENFDYFAINGEGHTYHDLSTTNTGGQYRTSDGVDIETCSEGGYNLTGIEAGEWLTYTVYVPTTALYNISINYAAANADGKIKFIVGGIDKTDELTVPFGTGYSTGLTDWKNNTIATDIKLNAGVQSFKVLFSGASNAFKLNSFNIIQSGVAKQNQEITFYTLPIKLLSSADLTLEAKASSALPVSFASSNETVATIVSGKIHPVSEGTAVITASQAGNTEFFAAPNASQSIKIVSSSSSTTLPATADTYVNGGSTGTNYGTATTMVTKTSTTDRYAYLKFDLSAIPGPIVSATLQLYNRLSIKDTRVVYEVVDDSWTEIGLTWNNKPVYGNQRASTAVVGGLNSWDVSSLVAQEYAKDKVVSLVVNDPIAAHNTGIDFYSKENGSSMPALIVEYTTQTATQNQTINFPVLSVKYLGNADFNPGATASSGLAVTYSSSNPLVAIIENSKVQILGVGSSEITAIQPGDAIYNPATKSQTLTVKADSVTGFFTYNQIKIVLYPNPVNNNLVIENAEGSSLELYNQLGALVLVKNKLERNQNINMSHFPNGIYILKLNNRNGTESRKLIKI